jgi:hypothetical protein
MPAAPIYYTARAPGGQAIEGATVYVTAHPSGAGVALWQDEDLSIPHPGVTGVYTTDSAGRATYGGQQIWVAAGRYDLQISGPTLTTLTVVRDFFSPEHVNRDVHSWTQGDANPVDAGTTRLGSFVISLAAQELAVLQGVYYRCESSGTTVFSVLTDHDVRGTFAAVAGLSTIQPATGASAFSAPDDGPMSLSEGDTVIVAVPVVGTTKGHAINVIVDRYFP